MLNYTLRTTLSVALWLKLFFVIAWYHAPRNHPEKTVMPYIPYSDLDPATGLLPESNPASGLVNPVVQAYCSTLVPLQDFYRDSLNYLVPGAGDIANLPALAINGALCPLAPPGSRPPASILPGQWGSGCASSGFVSGYLKIGGASSPNPPILFSETWVCGDPRGLPVEAPRYGNNPPGSNYGWTVMCARSDGSLYRQDLTPLTAFNVPEWYVVTAANFDPCPGCSVPQVIPRRPGYPPRLPPLLPPAPPQIPVTINLPQLPGLPDLAIPLTFSPVFSPAFTFAPIVLAPNLGLQPQFEFAPTVELNLGGLTITGGGYPEPIQNVQELCPGGGDPCPDPCPDIDYGLITQIVFDELDLKFPPARPVGTATQVFTVAGSGEVILPDFSQWIEVQIITPPPNVRSQYGGEFAPSVKYNGWISFGATTTVSERIPLHYDLTSWPVPDKAFGFSWTIHEGGTAKITISYQIASEVG